MGDGLPLHLKVLVFSDVVWALEKYSKTLQRPYIHGKVNNEDRLQWFEQFIINPECNTLFMSRVGDVAVDLPAANVIIQVSSHFGSRRQEAQRLGRILRPDENRRESDVVRADRPAEAFFYSLVSMDTQETYYSTKRQAFLVDQGYTFKVVTGLPPPDRDNERDPYHNYTYGRKEDQLNLLAEIRMLRDDKEALKEDKGGTKEDREGLMALERGVKRRETMEERKKAKSRRVSMSRMSGGDDHRYMEASSIRRQNLVASHGGEGLGKKLWNKQKKRAKERRDREREEEDKNGDG